MLELITHSSITGGKFEVLVDFENFQPKNMGLLNGAPFKIKVFIGVNQKKNSLEMACTMQMFASDAEHIQTANRRSNGTIWWEKMS